MLPAKPAKRKQERLSIRAAAKRLGVEQSHLNRVVRGLRESRSLMHRYRALKATQTTTLTQ